ncbi:MAG: tetratricopeptide repeat protein [Fretibacterium sp.]|nr:tetratricopeptide repeat protein [Fretibacterium sp.]
MPSLKTRPISMPDGWSLEGLLDDEQEEQEESEGRYNKDFTRKLHKGLQEQKKGFTSAHQPRKPAPTLRYWLHTLAFSAILLFTLGGAWTVLHYLQVNIGQLTGRGDLNRSVLPETQTDVRTEDGSSIRPAAASVTAEKPPAPPATETPASQTKETVPATGSVQPKERSAPTEKPETTEKPAVTPTEKPLEKPAQPAEKPETAEKPAVTPTEKPAEKPTQPAERPETAEKPAATPTEKPAEKPAQPAEKPETAEKPAATPTEKPAPSSRKSGPAEPVLPLSYEGQVRLGTAALNNGRYDEAMETFSQALERRKDDPRAWLGIVAAFEGKGAVGEAFRVLVDARNTLPRNPTIEVKLRDLQRRIR